MRSTHALIFAAIAAASTVPSISASAERVCNQNCIGPLCNEQCTERTPEVDVTVGRERRDREKVIIEERDRRLGPDVEIRKEERRPGVEIEVGR
jgi:hypothetical protein